VDVQVVAATNRNLEAEVGEGRFREDLYFRLNMFVLRIPPLRERLVDVPVLMQFFSKHFAQRYGRDEWQADAETVRQFCEYHWPGNVRQLAHAIEQAYVLDAAPSLPTLKLSKRESSLPYFNLSRLRRTAVLQALRATRGHKGQAAKLLGVHANTLTRILAAMDNMPDG
jgi:DNA-binding NtrC family response regulator